MEECWMNQILQQASWGLLCEFAPRVDEAFIVAGDEGFCHGIEAVTFTETERAVTWCLIRAILAGVRHVRSVPQAIHPKRTALRYFATNLTVESVSREAIFSKP